MISFYLSSYRDRVIVLVILFNISDIILLELVISYQLLETQLY